MRGPFCVHALNLDVEKHLQKKAARRSLRGFKILDHRRLKIPVYNGGGRMDGGAYNGPNEKLPCLL